MARIGWGDELICTGHVRELYDVHKKKIRISYERNRWHEAFDHNPKILKPGEVDDHIEFEPRTRGLRPYCKSKSSTRWEWMPYKPPRGELFFTEEELKFRNVHLGRVIFEPKLKLGASPNKQWDYRRWGELNRLTQLAGIRVTQLGPAYIEPMLSGVEYLQTRTMRLAAAVISGAKAVVTHEGATHHAAAAFRIPTIVLYGGYISPAVTGYDDQVSLFSGNDLGCGWRTPCEHCRKAMDSIAPELVFEKLMGLLNGNL